MHNFNMRNSQLLIRKVNLGQKVDLSQVKLNKRTKSSISFKAKSKRSSLQLNNKIIYGSELHTIASLESFRSSQLFTARNSISTEEQKFRESSLTNFNNYQYFPKRSLLTKPHMVKNTKITLNLFGKKMIDNEEKLSVLAQSLYKQLNQMRTSVNHPQKQTLNHTPRKPRIITRVQSAPFRRQDSLKFQPWDIGESKQDENR